MREETRHEDPVCVAVVICNDVIEDKRTNNKTLVGLFNAISVPGLPVSHPRMSVLVSITNVVRTTNISVVLRAPSGGTILEVGGPIESDDPLSVQDLVVELMGTPFEESGVYFVDVLAESRYLGGRRFWVTLEPPSI